MNHPLTRPVNRSAPPGRTGWTDGQRAGPIVWICVIAVTCVLLVALEHTLWLTVPFIFGTVLYYILLAPMQRLIRAGVGQDLAALSVGLMFFCVLALVLAGLSSLITVPDQPWRTVLARYIDGGFRFIRQTLRVLENWSPLFDQMNITTVVTKRIKAFTDGFAQNYMYGILIGVLSWLPSLLLAPFLTYFFLRDGARFKMFLARAVPNAFFERTLYLLHEVDQTARRYFEGLLKLTIIDTVVLALGLWAIGVGAPILLGFVSAVLAWIPFVGSVVGCIMVVMVATTDAPSNPLIGYGAIGVFVAVRLLDDFVFMPLTVGRSLKIHPLMTVLMIFIGGAVAGVAGLMLVLPLFGVVMVVGETLGRLITNPRLRARHRNAMALRAKQASVDLVV
jgi:predicted PurR-regulated permease PerM